MNRVSATISIGDMKWWLLVVVVNLILIAPVAALGKIQRFTTANGIEVYLVEEHGNPMVVLSLISPGGSAQDPPGLEGLAGLTAAVMDEGAGELTSAELREELDYYGIRLGVTAERDWVELSATTLTTHLERTLGYMAEVVLRPRFDAADFEVARNKRLNALKLEREDPEKMAGKKLAELIYGTHPYGHAAGGDETSLAKIRLEDLKQFQKRLFHVPDLIVVAAGDCTLEQLGVLLDQAVTGFDPTPAGWSPIPVASDPQVIPPRTHLEMELPQTTIRIGRIGINRADPDYYAVQVFNHLLGGGGLVSRLSQELREKRGFTYGVFSSFNPLAGRGAFSIGMNTKTSNTGKALEVLFRELERLRVSGVKESELADVKLDLTGSFPLRLSGLSKVVDHLAVIGYYDLGLDYLEKWPERIQAVTREDVARVARRFLDPGQLVVVTAGKTAKVTEKKRGERGKHKH